MTSPFGPRLQYMEQHLRTLPDKPEETAESTLKALWMKAVGSPMSAERALTVELPDLDEEQVRLLDELIEERLSGIPLGHITGRQMFMGIEFIVSSAALLPRHETEVLARGAAKIVTEVIARRKSALVVDTCCGSGNVALAIAHEVPQVNVVGVDISNQAVELARVNARAMELQDRVEFRAGDLLKPVDDLAGTVDVLTCNPPYISSAKVQVMAEEIAEHEPELAFDGGPFGVKILGRLVKESPRIIRTGGYLVFEVGLGQGEPMVGRLEKSEHFCSIQPLLDQSENIRAIIAQRK